VLRDELEKLLLTNLNWPGGMEVEIAAATVFVRNSGTEDKLALYLRGRADLSGRLETLAGKIYPNGAGRTIGSALFERWSKENN